MKKGVLKIGLFSMVLLGIVSCKNKEKELAEQRITELETYVDSLKTANADELEANWDKIQMDFDRKNLEASDAITNLDNESKTSSQEKINSSTTKYDELKVNVTAKADVKKATAKPSASQLLRDRLFGAGKIGEDISFAWVNKDNILKVYDTFFQSYKDNKGDFSREDYDEIKLMYEGLDNRKNTVEKEGLTTEDNNKIASIKFKFGPMFKANRIGAKSRETAEAKE